jgi:hypothetical protein
MTSSETGAIQILASGVLIDVSPKGPDLSGETIPEWTSSVDGAHVRARAAVVNREIVTAQIRTADIHGSDPA